MQRISIGRDERDAEIGRLLASCGHRRIHENFRGQGGRVSEWARRLFLMAAATLVLSGWILKGFKSLGWIGGRPNPPLAGSLMLVVLILLAAGWVAVARRDARYVVLAVHERGFQYRVRRFLFDEIRSIEFGRPPSLVESLLISANCLFGRIKKPNAAAAVALEAYRANSLRIVRWDGEECILNGFLVVVAPDVARRFFDHIEEVRPGLIRWPTA